MLIINNNSKVTYTRLEQLRGNLHTNGAHKNNNDNTTLIFIGLHTTQKTQTSQEEGSARKDKERSSQANLFY
jgi:hypothetical protein